MAKRVSKTERKRQRKINKVIEEGETKPSREGGCRFHSRQRPLNLIQILTLQIIVINETKTEEVQRIPIDVGKSFSTLNKKQKQLMSSLVGRIMLNCHTVEPRYNGCQGSSKFQLL